MSQHIVAVYGSLREKMDNHHYIADGKRIALGWLTGYKMFNFGDYPGIVPTHDDSGRVRIEWYKVSDETLASLDNLEEYDPSTPQTSLYLRKPIFSPYGRGWIYVYNQPLEQSSYMEAGDWERFRRETKLSQEV
ncbi:gamma-glutamylcyclotransferase family protein [Marinomonas transparens]|uniref:Gamma-glutamylcyclotransferase n=1 Tax=Marinomonas transparens TaxID=2795388 RepID=A0A934JLJ0_9GAMM|nr:gamma-glutamylcyclotransferase family protein [Marinomonas transparens]MBJ7536279.1 gamma-glutamylcyclotransferase [Marinomonas transparens]